MRKLVRRDFMQLSVSSAVAGLVGGLVPAYASYGRTTQSESSRDRVSVARLYLGKPDPHWPTPLLDLDSEIRRYEAEFQRQAQQFADVDFAVDGLFSSPDQVHAVRERLADVDGILVIQLSIGTRDVLDAVLAAQKPTLLFAAPYSGHEWAAYGALGRENPRFDCILSSDFSQLAVAVRPFRAIHRLRTGRILNITARDLPADYVAAVARRFGTEIRKIDRERVLRIYDSVPEAAAMKEAQRWVAEAEAVVEPSTEEIIRSCRLALALEELLREESAQVVSVDCYGTMFRQLPAYPCIGFTRLNDRGRGGICESDLQCAVTHLLIQGLCGKPGFISDPTLDESSNAAILAHCLGSTRMDGPAGERHPYRLRSIMERQEGAVPQVRMRIGQRVTQLILVEADELRYFTGTIVDVPETIRGCRTKITVQVDGSVEHLWRNWTGGLHRQTCYGDLTADLRRFCRFKEIELVNEA
jgi:hypothetical protein